MNRTWAYSIYINWLIIWLILYFWFLKLTAGNHIHSVVGATVCHISAKQWRARVFVHLLALRTVPMYHCGKSVEYVEKRRLLWIPLCPGGNVAGRSGHWTDANVVGLAAFADRRLSASRFECSPWCGHQIGTSSAHVLLGLNGVHSKCWPGRCQSFD